MKVIVTYTNTNGKTMTETFKNFEEARNFYNELIKYSYLGFRVNNIEVI